jgi:gamma-glutamyltranspeptidase/glutathione hydrolase
MFSKLRTVALLALASNTLFPQLVASHPQHEVKDKKGAVASESEICSKIGIDLLKHGGNAADALVGTVLCVGVIGMYHSGQVLSIG